MKQWRELSWRLLPGGLVTSIVTGLSIFGLAKPVEQLSYNLLFQLRGPRAWDERVIVVEIDDSSIQRLGRYPWPRQRFTQLLKTLTAAEASVVAFDIVFSEASQEDADLALAIASHGRVILAQALDTNALPLKPVSTLRDAAIGVGHIYRKSEGDGITRAIPMAVRDEAALSFLALQTYGLEHAIPPLPSLDDQLCLNWVASTDRVPRYAFADVLRGNIAADALRDKIVLVGLTATGFDRINTPFNRDTSDTGVYLHATALNNLLHQQVLKHLPWLLVVFCLSAPLFGWGLSYCRLRHQLIVTGGLVLLWWIVGVIALSNSYYLPMALTTALLVGTMAAVVVVERLRLQSYLQKQLQRLSTTYLTEYAMQPQAAAADLVSQLEAVQSQPRSLQQRFNTAQPASIQTVKQLTQITNYFAQAQATRQAITQSLSVGLLAINLEGVVWFCNETAHKWLKVNVGDRLEQRLVPRWVDIQTWDELLWPLGQDDALPSTALKLDGSVEFSLSLLKTKDIEVLVNQLWYQLSFSMLPAMEDVTEEAFPSLVLLIEDITQRKQLETNLERQVQELQWLTQLKDELIGRVSHELKSPLTNMLVTLEALRDDNVGEPRNLQLDTLEQECLRELDFINDLLSLQTESPKKPVQNLTEVDLACWLDKIVTPFRARANTRQQTIELQLDDNLPQLKTDVRILDRICQELLTNACKYSPAGAKIACSIQMLSENIRLIVRNSGVTIAPDDLTRIFEKFYRASDHDPWQQGGMGLGLSIVERLTQQINGKITAYSQDDLTEFTLELPCASK